MKAITSIRDYQIIQQQKDVAVAILFYGIEDIESSFAETIMNKLDRKYDGEMLFFKFAFNDKSFIYDNQIISLPFIQIINDGYHVLFHNPIDFRELETKIITWLEQKEYALLATKPPRTERIKRKLIERNWIAWTLVIGTILVAVIRFIKEISQDSNTKKR
jgi:hypothetical protein